MDKRRLNHIAIALTAFAVNYGLDRITKLLAVTYLEGRRGLYFLFDTVALQYAQNSGAFLSMGATWPLWIKYAVLLVAPGLLCLYGLYYCLFRETDRLRSIFLATVIAGGLGNLIDRLLNHFMVIDFLNFGIGNIRTGILNVADLSICFGAAAFLIREWTRKPGRDSGPANR